MTNTLCTDRKNFEEWFNKNYHNWDTEFKKQIRAAWQAALASRATVVKSNYPKTEKDFENSLEYWRDLAKMQREELKKIQANAGDEEIAKRIVNASWNDTHPVPYIATGVLIAKIAAALAQARAGSAQDISMKDEKIDISAGYVDETKDFRHVQVGPSDKRCEVCGCPVRVVGDITKHYEINVDDILPSEEEQSDFARNSALIRSGINFIREHVRNKLGEVK